MERKKKKAKEGVVELRASCGEKVPTIGPDGKLFLFRYRNEIESLGVSGERLLPISFRRISLHARKKKKKKKNVYM